MGVIVFKHDFLAIVTLFLELSFLLDINMIGMAVLVKQHAAVDSVA